MGRLDGKVALVTGGARGQGRSHAVAMAREGADVVVVDIDSPAVEAVSYPLATAADLAETVSLVEEQGARAVARTADVRDPGQMRQAIADGVSELGEISVVAANAGIFPVAVDEPQDPVRRARVWQDTLDVNLTGVWNTIEAVVPRMVAAGNGGAIVITSSTQGLRGGANNDICLTAYTASKHGVVGLMRATAVDLAPHGIRVNSVHPTGVHTPMIENEIFGLYATKHPRLAELMANKLPVDAVEPEDITNAVLYLVADTGRYVTGVTLPVDAGYLL